MLGGFRLVFCLFSLFDLYGEWGRGGREKERLACLREENEIAWVSFAARRTVSLSAKLNKDRKPETTEVSWAVQKHLCTASSAGLPPPQVCVY